MRGPVKLARQVCTQIAIGLFGGSDLGQVLCALTVYRELYFFSLIAILYGPARQAFSI